jgi:hypothetical protein
MGLAAVAGGVVALIGVALVDPHRQLPHLAAVTIAVGVFAGVGFDRLLRG